MKITIEFSTANAAFGYKLDTWAGAEETARVLEQAETYIGENSRQSSFEVGLMDSNGNTVGTVKGEQE